MKALNKFLKQFRGINNGLDFAIDILREKYKMRIMREVYYIKSGANPDGRFSLIKECLGVKTIVLDEHGEIVCIGPREIEHLTEKSVKEIDWTDAYVEEYVKGEVATVFDHRNQPFIATEYSPKGKNLLPGKDKTLYSAICDCIAKKHKPPTVSGNVLYLFNPNYFYHLVYRPEKDDIFLVSVVDKHTFQEVSETRLDLISNDLKIPTPDYDIVVSFKDLMQYRNDVKAIGHTLVVKDNKHKFKIS